MYVNLSTCTLMQIHLPIRDQASLSMSTTHTVTFECSISKAKHGNQPGISCQQNPKMSFPSTNQLDKIVQTLIFGTH